jgi:hypothetical protein
MARRCAICRKLFEPRVSSLQQICSPACAIEFAATRPERMDRIRKAAARRERREYRAATETPAQARQKAQAAFNAWVRTRDAGLPCISCGHPNDGTRKWNAGHYRPAGTNPALRFEPLNVHGQCERCNSYLSGNLADYRIGLIKRIGLEAVEWLEGPHELPRRTVAIYRTIAAEYRDRLKTARAA